MAYVVLEVGKNYTIMLIQIYTAIVTQLDEVESMNEDMITAKTMDSCTYDIVIGHFM